MKPDYAEAHNNLGAALRDQGMPEEAAACCRRALELKPDFAEAHSNLGNALKDLGKPDEAVACYRRALELKPDHAQAHYNLGNVLEDMGKPEEAVACHRRALELKPDFAEAHTTWAVLCRRWAICGRGSSFRAALRHNPRFALAHYELAELLGGKLPEEDLAAQRRLLEQGSASGEQGSWPDAQRLLLHFGLARVLDARGEYAEAAEHLDRGPTRCNCPIGEARPGLRPERIRALVDPHDRGLRARFLRRVRGFGLESELPVFVVGLPRSGTTLIEQILASHSRVFAAGEITLARDTMAAWAERRGCHRRLRPVGPPRRPSRWLRDTWKNSAP